MLKTDESGIKTYTNYSNVKISKNVINTSGNAYTNINTDHSNTNPNNRGKNFTSNSLKVAKGILSVLLALLFVIRHSNLSKHAK